MADTEGGLQPTAGEELRPLVQLPSSSWNSASNAWKAVDLPTAEPSGETPALANTLLTPYKRS